MWLPRIWTLLPDFQVRLIPSSFLLSLLFPLLNLGPGAQGLESTLLPPALDIFLGNLVLVVQPITHMFEVMSV